MKGNTYINTDEHTKLKELRELIDSLDEELLDLLGQRIAVIKEAGMYKKVHDLPELDEKRWQNVLETRLAQAKELNLSTQFVTKLLELIHSYTLKIEADIKKQKP